MSEIEEPPAKVLKIQNIDGVTHVTEIPHLPDIHDGITLEAPADGDIAEEVHEEWLSDGILTDDDYQAPEIDDDQTDSQLGSSQDDEPCEEMERLESSMESEPNIHNNGDSVKTEAIEQHYENGSENNISNVQSNNTEAFEDNIKVTAVIGGVLNGIKVKAVDNNIEETIKQLDGSKDTEFTAEALEHLLIKPRKKPDQQIVKVDVKKETKSPQIDVGKFQQINIKSKSEQNQKTTDQKSAKVEVIKQKDDGNDTDDLLRMLEDDGKSKKLTKTVKDIRRATPGDVSSDDDDFVYEGSAKKLKAVKSAITRKPPTKAIPEDLDDDDGDDEKEQSADETTTMKRIFSINSPNLLIKHKNKQNNSGFNDSAVLKKTAAKNIVNVVDRSVNNKSTPIRQFGNKKGIPSKPILKTPTNKSVETKTNILPQRKPETRVTFKAPEVAKPAPFKSIIKTEVKKDIESIEMMESEEYLDEDQFDMEEDLGESDMENEDLFKDTQRLMRPEIMDEEIPSDGDSHSEDGSLYDELPSSDSEDMDDWFTLDIRTEKAGDYIPLLGHKAKELLLEEKRRAGSRLQTLKQSLTALTESGKQQAEQLREATMTLAQLDDMLKAS